MDRLKGFIEDNMEEFNAEVMLPAGHLERFERKLNPHKKRGVYRLIAVGLAVAASVAIILLSNRGETIISGTDDIDMVARTQEIDMEMKELRIYYNMRMSDIHVEMKRLYESNRSDGAKELLLEGRRILADNSDFENRVLPSLPCSDEAIFAMTQHYSNSMNGLNIMLDRMRVLTYDRNIENN